MSARGHLFLVGHYEPDGQHSMRHYGDLVAGLFAEAGWTVTRRQPVPPVRPGFLRRLAGPKWAGHWDKWVRFPRELRAALRDWTGRTEPGRRIVLLPDHSHSPYARTVRALGLPVLAVCHDLMAVRGALGEIPQHRPRWSGRRLQEAILAGLSDLSAAVAVSEATRRDVERLVPALRGRVRVVRSALNAPYGPLAPAAANARLERWPALQSGGRFFLHVGNNSWYKNRDGLLVAYGKLRESWAAPEPCPDLVLAGAGLSSHQAAWVAGAPWVDSVRPLGPVTGPELEALYNRALAFVFPSWEEGFGWPPLEAQACGCPVIASRGGALAEVLGDSAVPVKPEDTEGLAEAMREAATVPGWAERWVEAGRRNVARFSREAMQRGLVTVAEDLAAAAAMEERR